jgi:hypothetical protein
MKLVIKSASLATFTILSSCATIRIPKSDFIDYFHTCGEATTFTVDNRNKCFIDYDSTKSCDLRSLESPYREILENEKSLTFYKISPFTHLIFQESKGIYKEIRVDMNTQISVTSPDQNVIKMYLALSTSLIGANVYGYRSRILMWHQSANLDSAKSIGIYAEQPFNYFPTFSPSDSIITDDDILNLASELKTVDSVQFKFFNPLCGNDSACKTTSRIYDASSRGLVFNVSDKVTLEKVADALLDSRPYESQKEMKCLMPNRLIGAIIFFPVAKYQSAIFSNNRKSMQIGKKYGIAKTSISNKIYTIVANGKRAATFIVNNP